MDQWRWFQDLAEEGDRSEAPQNDSEAVYYEGRLGNGSIVFRGYFQRQIPDERMDESSRI